MNSSRLCQDLSTPPAKLVSKIALFCSWGSIKGRQKAANGFFTAALLLWLDGGIVFALPPQNQLAQSSPTAQNRSETNQLYVNPTAGNDTTGNGSDRAPFKTITQALRVAKENTVIYLTSGTYSQQTGETFPIELKPNVTLQGDPPSKGRSIIIKGGGLYLSPTFARQNVAILAGNKSGIAGVTVTNPNGRGYGLWIESSSPVVADNTFIGNTHDGISVAGNSTPLIRNNYFTGNGANGITIYGTSRPELRENVFEKTGFGVNIGQNAAPILNGNRIVQNTDGIVIQGKARPILRRNSIEGNSRDGLVALTETYPDLGTAQEPGGNIFRNNGRYELNTSAAVQIIPAFGNQLASRRIAGRINLDGNVAQVAAIPVPPPSDYSASPGVGQIPGQETAVQIAVPRPASARPRFPRRSRAARARRRRVARRPPQPPATIATGASIPVSAPASPPPQTTGIPSAGIQAGVLPVPDGGIPLGSTPTIQSSPTAALGQRYRVVVEVRSTEEMAKLQALVPEAVRTLSQGRVVMLVGAYSDRAEADRMLEKINSNGLIGTIEEIN